MDTGLSQSLSFIDDPIETCHWCRPAPPPSQTPHSLKCLHEVESVSTSGLFQLSQLGAPGGGKNELFFLRGVQGKFLPFCLFLFSRPQQCLKWVATCLLALDESSSSSALLPLVVLHSCCLRFYLHMSSLKCTIYKGQQFAGFWPPSIP